MADGSGPCQIFTDNRIQKGLEYDAAAVAFMQAVEAELDCLTEHQGGGIPQSMISTASLVCDSALKIGRGAGELMTETMNILHAKKEKAK